MGPFGDDKFMDDEDYLRDHAVELSHQISRFTYFQNLLAEPRNQEFFNTLDPKTLELIRSHMKESAAMSVTFQMTLHLHGVNMADGKLLTGMPGDGYEVDRQTLVMMKQNAKTAARDRETRDREINEKYSRIEERRAKLINAVPKNLDLSGKAGDEQRLNNVKKALSGHQAKYGKHRFHDVDPQFWVEEFDWMKDMNNLFVHIHQHL